MTLPILIIGAGVSGLSAARALHRRGLAVRVLEARARPGGRVLGHGADALDLGPAWVWPEFQPTLAARFRELGLTTAPQFEQGDFLLDAPAGPQRYQGAQRHAGAHRLPGGLTRLVTALVAQLPPAALRFGAIVRRIEMGATPRVFLEDGEAVDAAAIILALPPRLALRIAMQPALPPGWQAAMAAQPTWMAAHAKAIVLYDRPFWRAAGLAGTSASRLGPLGETTDLGAESTHALAGFLAWPAGRRAAEAMEPAIREQLARLFGPEAAAPRQIIIQDWTREPFTAAPEDAEAPPGHPEYGPPILARLAFEGRLALAGAETSRESGGLIEGAILAGERAAAQVAGAIQPDPSSRAGSSAA